MTGRCVAVCALGLVAFAVAACSRPATGSDAARVSDGDAPFIVADLRWDDALTPIARFTHEMWMNTWPPADAANVPVPPLNEIPETWLDQPVPREWHLWQHGVDRRVAVVGARRAERDPTAGCSSPAVLDLAKPAGSPHDFYGESGIAVNTSQVVDDVRVIDHHSDEWRAMQESVMTTVGAAERDTLSSTQHSWLDDALGEVNLTLARFPLVVEVSHPVASTTETSGVYFFEATRKDSTPRGLLGFKVFGWLRHDAAGAWIADHVQSATISEEGTASLGPMAGFRVRGREFWLMFSGGIESGGYSIYEITAATVLKLLDASGFGC